jgi:hypothetical protein
MGERTLTGPWLAAMVVLLLAPAPETSAQAVCRPNELGSVRCPVGRPMPRPLYQPDTQAIDRVRRRPDPETKTQTFVPARRTNRLGETLLDPDDGPVSLCQPDRLGHLRCR